MRTSPTRVSTCASPLLNASSSGMLVMAYLPATSPISGLSSSTSANATEVGEPNDEASAADSPARSASMSCVSSGEMKRHDGHHEAVHSVMRGWLDDVERRRSDEKSSAERTDV